MQDDPARLNPIYNGFKFFEDSHVGQLPSISGDITSQFFQVVTGYMNGAQGDEFSLILDDNATEIMSNGDLVLNPDDIWFSSESASSSVVVEFLNDNFGVRSGQFLSDGEVGAHEILINVKNSEGRIDQIPWLLTVEETPGFTGLVNKDFSLVERGELLSEARIFRRWRSN